MTIKRNIFPISLVSSSWLRWVCSTVDNVGDTREWSRDCDHWFIVTITLEQAGEAGDNDNECWHSVDRGWSSWTLSCRVHQSHRVDHAVMRRVRATLCSHGWMSEAVQQVELTLSYCSVISNHQIMPSQQSDADLFTHSDWLLGTVSDPEPMNESVFADYQVVLRALCLCFSRIS